MAARAFFHVWEEKLDKWGVLPRVFTKTRPSFPGCARVASCSSTTATMGGQMGTEGRPALVFGAAGSWNFDPTSTTCWLTVKRRRSRSTSRRRSPSISDQRRPDQAATNTKDGHHSGIAAASCATSSGVSTSISRRLSSDGSVTPSHGRLTTHIGKVQAAHAAAGFHPHNDAKVQTKSSGIDAALAAGEKWRQGQKRRPLRNEYGFTPAQVAAGRRAPYRGTYETMSMKGTRPGRRP
jgi:hypothetical protein